MPAPTETELYQLTLTRGEFSILNAVITGMFAGDLTMQMKTIIVIKARKEDAHSFLTKVSLLAQSEMDKRTEALNEP